MLEVQIAFKVTNFSTFKQSKHIKMVALMLLLREATTEEKTTTCTDRCYLKNHWRPQIIQEIWIHTSRNITCIFSKTTDFPDLK